MTRRVQLSPNSPLNALPHLTAAEEFKAFDTSIVLYWGERDLRVGTALDTLLPNGRYKSGYRRGRFKNHLVRRLLEDMAKRGFISTDRRSAGYHWWFLNEQDGRF